MRRLILMLCISVLATGLFAQVFSKKDVETRIDKVTIFLNGAQVSRKANIHLVKGKTEYVLKGLSPYMTPQSLQVKIGADVTILSVVHQINHLVEQQKGHEIEELEIKKQALADQITQDSSLLAVYNQEEVMLGKNQQVSGLNTGLKVADLREAIDFQRSRMIEVKNKEFEFTKKIRVERKELDKLNQQLRSLHISGNIATSDVYVVVDSKIEGDADIFASYYVDHAHWFPTYDLRAKDINSPISLAYKANIVQNTGEDWKNVRLSLSNSNPVESGNKPVLNPWYLRQISYSPVRYENVSALAMVSGVISGKVIDGNDGSPLPGTTVTVEGSSVGTVTDEQGNYSLNLPSGAQTLTFSFIGYETYKTPISSKIINASLIPQNLQLDEVAVVAYGVSKKMTRKVANINTVSTSEKINQTNVQFDIELPYSIPADGKVYSADVKQMEIPADYEYYCVPKLDKDVFLTAKISNWEEYNLLDGEMNLYFEGTYVGKSVLDVRNVTDTLQISLGRDKNIVVTRTKQKEFSKSQFLGNNKTEMRAFTIDVRNKKQQPVSLILEDQFPVSTDKEITVRKTDYSGATVDDQIGKVTWKLILKPTEEQKVNLGYLVEHPKNKPVVLE